MFEKFIGVRVKLLSIELGSIEGTVTGFDDMTLDLSNVSINNRGNSLESYSLNQQFISDIEILEIPSSGDPCQQPPEISKIKTTPIKSQSMVNPSATTPRHERREFLRNIPNTENAYVCPDSPPQIHRSHGIKKNLPKINNPANVSGYESDPAPAFRHDKLNITPSRRNRKDSYNHQQNSKRTSGSSKASAKETTIAWESINVEDFVDEDFDFEGSNAQFDKQACYSQIEAECKIKKNSRQQVVNQKISTTNTSFPTVESLASLVKARNEQTSKPINSTSAFNHVDIAKIEKLAMKVSTQTHQMTLNTSVVKVDQMSANESKKPLESFYLSLVQRNRLMHFMATGIDPKKEWTSTQTPANEWKIMVEHLCTSTSSFLSEQRLIFPGCKVVLVLSGPNFGGFLGLHLVQHLIDLGCSVVCLWEGQAKSQEDTFFNLFYSEIDRARFYKTFSETDDSSKNLLLDNVWEKRQTGCELITCKQMLGCQYNIDLAIWGNGLSELSKHKRNTGESMILEAARWISIHAKSLKHNLQMVNDYLSDAINLPRAFNPEREYLLEVGFPVVRIPLAASLTESKEAKTIILTRIPIADRILQHFVKTGVIVPSGPQFDCFHTSFCFYL